jgi:DNA-binding winged helix-turn-helix (wHTH) protein/class 3 adenylate cyclase
MIYSFGDYKLDTTLYELRVAGQPSKLEPRVFNVLAYLVQHRTHVVTREELLDHLWPGLAISDTLLNNCIMEARKAVGDSGHAQQVIKTLHGRGYRFIAPTTEQPVEEDPPRAIPECTESSLTPVHLSQNRVIRGALATGVQCDTFQDVLAGSQTVGTVVCGTLDQGDVHRASGGYEAVQRLRQTFFALAQEEAQRSAGACTFFGADGIVLRFTQEAHTQRAVCAALRLQRRVQAYTRTLDAQLPVDVTMRYGVHTGPLALATVPEIPWCSSVTTAETTTVAVWLHYLALPGTLLTSQATLQFLPKAVPCVEHGPVRLPGQAEPIMAYYLGGRGASDPCPEASSPDETH